MANSWRHERWDPAPADAQLAKPVAGFTYEGADPDGFMRAEVVSFIDAYARTIEAPVHAGLYVTSVRADDSGYVVDTNRDMDLPQCRPGERRLQRASDPEAAARR